MILRVPSLHRVEHALQVLPHSLDAERSVAHLDGLENGEVVEVIAFARTEDAEDQSLLVGKQVVQDVEQLRENGIARRARDLAVEPHVHFMQHGVVVQILAGRGEQPSHLDEILERSILDGVGNGLRLERHARANEIEQ